MQPHKASIVQDLIEKNRRQFKIPVYQRNYDWSHTECAKLYEDILEAFEKDKKHFTATISKLSYHVKRNLKNKLHKESETI